MKLTTFILLVAVMQITARSNAQIAVTYSGRSVTLQTIFTTIEAQAGYSFFYKDADLKGCLPVTINLNSVPLEDALKKILAGQPLTYRIRGKTIFINKKKADADLIRDTSFPVGSSGRPAALITGIVRNAEGEPLVGTSIRIKGITTTGTTTDANGRFSLNVQPGQTLIITYTGYEEGEIVVTPAIVASDQQLRITLLKKENKLEEVTINAGYYNVKEREGTGNIERIDAKVIENQSVTNPLGTLQGRMSGVYVQQTSGTPGGEFKIQIRGRNSLRDDGNEPLFIVDGVPFSTEKTFSSYATGSFGIISSGASEVSPLTSLNLVDIESIEVLKDADATAIYGSRGANGVVLITTKKGKAGKTSFDLNVYGGIGKAPSIKLLNTKQFLNLRREAFANDGLTPSTIPGDPGYSPELMIWDTTRFTDWQKELIGGTAQIHSAQGSISGGSDLTQFLFSGSYRSENSVYPGDFGYQKAAFHISTNHQSAGKKFFINLSINGAKDNNNQPNLSYTLKSRSLAPNAPALYNENGELNWENSTWDNPLAEGEIRYSNNVLNFVGNSVIGYNPAPGLQFKTSFGINILQSKEQTNYPHTYENPAEGYTSAQSMVNVANGSNQLWVIEPQLNWERKILKGKLLVLAGFTLQEQQFERKADSYVGFPSDALMDNLASAKTVMNFEFVKSLYRYAAAFGRLNYTWNKKYILNITARRDGSSRFGPGRKFGNFGAAGIAWIFSNEPFILENFSFISFGKLRGSYGSTGNDQIGNYQYIDSYTTNRSPSISSQYQGVTWISPTKLYNPDYAWEVNNKFEAGLEIGLFNDRISFSSSYFNNHSSNQLVNYTLPQTTGFQGILANLPATVQNTGAEFEIASTNIRSKRLQWTTSANITIPRNKLVSFPALQSSTYSRKYVIGQPLNITMAYEYTGVSMETGLWTFKDVNNDGVISTPEDRVKPVFIGQNLFGGVNNHLTYNGWLLDVFFQFVKQSGLSFYKNGFIIPGSQNNIPEFLIGKKIWRHPGDIAEIQKAATSNNSAANTAHQNYLSSDATVVDASFIRLKNIYLSYQFPKRLAKNIEIKIYLQGQNLLLFTGFEGGDPENQAYSQLSPLKMLTTGLQIRL